MTTGIEAVYRESRSNSRTECDGVAGAFEDGCSLPGRVQISGWYR